MKKGFMFLLCTFLCSHITLAQHRVGEAFIKDGIPCIVISATESGDHGLVMSLIPTNKVLKTAKKTGEWKWFYHPTKLKGADNKRRQEFLDEFYNRTKCDELRIRTSGISTAPRTTTSKCGKDVMRDLAAFCNEKGIEMEMYFPEFHWAQSLGEGWYIPGADELREFIKMLGFEDFGVDFGKRSIMNDMKETLTNFRTSMNVLSQTGDIAIFQDTQVPWYYILSSTITSNNQSGKGSYLLSLMQLVKKSSGKKFFDMVYYTNSSVCAVCEF